MGEKILIILEIALLLPAGLTACEYHPKFFRATKPCSPPDCKCFPIGKWV